MSKIDWDKLTVEEADELVRQSARTDEERVRDWTVRKVATHFREANPDYVSSPHNNNLLQAYVEAFGLPMTVESIEQVYKQLSEEGALER